MKIKIIKWVLFLSFIGVFSQAGGWTSVYANTEIGALVSSTTVTWQVPLDYSAGASQWVFGHLNIGSQTCQISGPATTTPGEIISMDIGSQVPRFFFSAYDIPNCGGGSGTDGTAFIILRDPSNPNGTPLYYISLFYDGSTITAGIEYSSDVGIISIDSPPNNGVSPLTVASTTVTFSATVINDSAQFVRFQLQNFDAGITLSPIDAPLFASGLTSASITEVLLPGYYSGTVAMIGGSTQATDILPLEFVVISSAYEGTAFPNIGTAASTTAPFCTDPSNILVSFGCALVIPSPQSLSQFNNLSIVARDKIPFAYFFQVRDTVGSSTSATATSLGTMTWTVTSSTTPYLPFTATMFSSSTLRVFVPDVAASGLRSLSTAVFYVEFLWYVWRRSKHLIERAHHSS